MSTAISLITPNPWLIQEEGLHPDSNEFFESVSSLGNGKIGIRGFFEEKYTGHTLPGTYLAGVWFPDKTKFGWWKNFYPEYFAKVINAPSFVGCGVELDGLELDLGQAAWKTESFNRTLDMRRGTLQRTFTTTNAATSSRFQVECERFCCTAEGWDDVAALSYAVTPTDRDCEVSLEPSITGDVWNRDSTLTTPFWEEVSRDSGSGLLVMRTVKPDFLAEQTRGQQQKGERLRWDLQFTVGTAMTMAVTLDGMPVADPGQPTDHAKYVGRRWTVKVPKGQTLRIIKYASSITSRYCDAHAIPKEAVATSLRAAKAGWDALLSAHVAAWARRWEESDIVITGDVGAQQGIRFNIFHLNQTYTGKDPELNIGPKGFTGEKYGGVTYWDTEAYCINFYLSSSPAAVSRQLLKYRYYQLKQACDNARDLGCRGALYPMVTMNGVECHNEWEITFEEIHRNAAIAFAVFNYVRYTGDSGYLEEGGFEVVAQTARYWTSRAHYSTQRTKWVIHGVTGPNEFENNVNNNWYTNSMAQWNIRYALQVQKELAAKQKPEKHAQLLATLELDAKELAFWKEVADNIYLPVVQGGPFDGVFEQQDGYMDKDHSRLVKDLPKEDVPIVKNWSWDRILRSIFIKQADVLQGLFFLNDQFTMEEKRKNFDFYTPRTVHDSSLSPCVHSILAAELGKMEEAYTMYKRSARLDLDQFNRDSDEGLHITSMAGTWMSVVHGFGGLRVRDDRLSLAPQLPAAWTGLRFRILFRERLIEVNVDGPSCSVRMLSGKPMEMEFFGKVATVSVEGELSK